MQGSLNIDSNMEKVMHVALETWKHGFMEIHELTPICSLVIEFTM